MRSALHFSSLLTLAGLAGVACEGRPDELAPPDMALPASGTVPLSIRAPAVPLLVRDPYLNVWIDGDRPAEVQPRTWNGQPFPLGIAARIDRAGYRLVGTEPAGATPLSPTSVEIRPSRTSYHYDVGGVTVTASFITPALPTDAPGASLPGALIELSAASSDGTDHELSFYLELGAAAVRPDPDAPIEWKRILLLPASVSGVLLLDTASAAAGTARPYAERDEQADWGTLALLTMDVSSLSTEVTAPEVVRGRFLGGAALAGTYDRGFGSANSHPLVFAYEWGHGETLNRYEYRARLLVARTRSQVVRFGDVDCWGHWSWDISRGPWAGPNFDGLDATLARVEAHDDALQAAAMAGGGRAYNDLVTLAYRQTLGATESCRTADGDFLFMKELASGSLIQTADVLYPALPFFAVENPRLITQLLAPFFLYVERSGWAKEYPPHDLGIYPMVGPDPHFADTPVESAGDLLIAAAVELQSTNDRSLCAAHLPLLRRWADYLVATGIDAPEQLSTDDFTGPLAHNATLGLKAALGVGAFAQIAKRLNAADADHYDSAARAMYADWQRRADGGDHLDLVLDDSQGWSLKYNLYIDRLLGLDYAPAGIVSRELAFYRQHLHKYGPPLDYRFPWAKADWQAWTAALGTQDDFDALIAPIGKYLDETPDRVPFADLYDADSGARTWAFQARPVVGGAYARLALLKAASQR